MSNISTINANIISSRSRSRSRTICRVLFRIRIRIRITGSRSSSHDIVRIRIIVLVVVRSLIISMGSAIVMLVITSIMRDIFKLLPLLAPPPPVTR